MSIIEPEPTIQIPGSGDGNVLKKVVKIIKAIWDIIPKKTPEKVSKADPVNSNSSLDDINKISEIFESYKRIVDQKSKEIENSISEEMKPYLEELEELIAQNSQTMKKYGVRTTRIRRQIDKLNLEEAYVIQNEISKSVSLDNAECKAILKMIPGEKKESAMREFLELSLKQALDKYCVYFRSRIEEIFDGFSEEIEDAVESVQLSLDSSVNELSKIKESNQEVQIEQMQELAEKNIAVCTMVIECLEGC